MIINYKKIVILFFFIFRLINAQSETDSIYFAYNNQDAYKLINSGFNFSKSDSLTTFLLKGLNSYTIYDEYSKNMTEFEGEFSANINSALTTGGLIKTEFTSNSSSANPIHNELKLMPLVSYIYNNLNLKAAGGYISKNDEIISQKGTGIEFDGQYNYSDKVNKILLRSDLIADGLNDEINYQSTSGFSYFRPLSDSKGNFSVNAAQNIHQYHIPYLDSTFFKIKRQEYDITSSLKYFVSDKIRNISTGGYYERRKDSYKEDEFLNYNSNSSILISNEILFDNEKFFSSFKVDYDTGSDKYSLDYDFSDRSFSIYNFTLNTSNSYKFSDYSFGLSGRYLKQEYKSLTDTDTDDRDIIKMSLTPDFSFDRFKFLKLKQSFPLVYYHLVNISSEKSNGNYTDRAINSVTELRSEINEDLYIVSNIHLRSYYRSYDYDDKYTNSFIIKNYSFSDTISHELFYNLKLKLANKYIYEEMGNFNYDNFTENPHTYKNHYYSSLTVLINLFKSLHLMNEYYFYEIDTFSFDQGNFDKSELDRVYITHGPKIGLKYNYKKFELYSGFEIDNYRNDNSTVKFKIESSISFD